MDIIEWIQNSGILILALGGLIGALVTIASGGGKFGKYIQSKITSELEDEMEQFMKEHEGCKPSTKKAIEDLQKDNDEEKKDIQKIYTILEKENQSRKLIFRILDVHSDHIIYDNHIDSVKEMKEELHEHLLNR